MVDDMRRLVDENRRLKTAVKELAVINEIAGVINSTMPVEEISRRIMDKVVAALKASEAAVHLFSDKDDQLTPHTFVRGKQDDSSTGKARLDITITGWIARNNKPFVVNDISKDPRFRDANLGSVPVDSLLAVPLTAKGQLIGALTAFNSRNPEGFAENDIRLLTIIGVQSAQIIENARLYQEELHLRQLQGEIKAAQKIQEGFLPESNPEVNGFDIFGGSLAAKDVGGDFYDFIFSTTDKLYFSIGDVSGKGMPAALLMSTIQGQVRLLISRNNSMSPADILWNLNQITYQLSQSTQFATMMIGCMTAGNSSLILANGGHCYPIIIGADGLIREISESSLIVGIVEKAEFINTNVSLNQGDVLALASDGIDEAFNSNGDEFGLDQLKAVLLKSRDLSAQDIYKHVFQAIADFRGEAEQSDDITLLIIKRD
ncbi:MAG: SpoIIE family protein phosphatase [FCB group bacterium]|nr:SpoIIE family protein phosphatase [FCB group bacterium]